MIGRFSCLILLLLAVISGCGSSGDEKKAAPEYAATPRKALESWVSAVREGDIEMMCRLLYPHRACDEAFVESKLPNIRAEMRGLTGELQYGAVGQGPRGVIGVVSGESSAAYAVKVFRGITQWVIAREARYVPGVAPIVLEHPDPATVLASGRTAISFLTYDYTTGSTRAQNSGSTVGTSTATWTASAGTCLTDGQSARARRAHDAEEPIPTMRRPAMKRCAGSGLRGSGLADM